MNVLVTGATGKVGSRLVPSLLSGGHSVRILVRRTDDETVRKLKAKGAETFIGDIMQPESLQEALDGVDAIVHLAAFFRSQDAEKIKSVNEIGTKNIAEAASQINTGIRFVFSSTSNVYNNETAPGLESDLVSPAAAYPAQQGSFGKTLAWHARGENNLTFASCVLRFRIWRRGSASTRIDSVF